MESFSDICLLEKNKDYLENIIAVSNLRSLVLDDKKVVLFLLNLEHILGLLDLKQFVNNLYQVELNAYDLSEKDKKLSLFQKRKQIEKDTEKSKEELIKHISKNYFGFKYNLEWTIALAKIKEILTQTSLVKDGHFIRKITEEEAKNCLNFLDVGTWSLENFKGVWEIGMNQTPLIENVFKSLDLEKVPDNVKEENITFVNQNQKEFCDKKKMSLNFESFDSSKRTLVLYYRANIKEIDFALIAETSRKFIEEKFSCIFNDILILSRHPFGSPMTVSRKIKYFNIKHDEFRDTCSLYANTMHLEHGTPFEFERGSPPLLSAAVRSDHKKIKGYDGGQDYVELNMYLDRREGKRPNGICDGNYTKMVEEVVRALQEVEEIMLKKNDLC